MSCLQFYIERMEVTKNNIRNKFEVTLWNFLYDLSVNLGRCYADFSVGQK